MRIDDFARVMADLLPYCTVAPEWNLRWTVIANPRAGGFTIASRWKRHYADLVQTVEYARQHNPCRNAAGRSAEPSALTRESGGLAAGTGLVVTEGPGFAARVTERLVREALERPGLFHLVICAGGDGTSLEVLGALYNAPEEVRDRFAVLRLPLGTGNDGAESRNLAEALQFLTGPTVSVKSPALRLVTATPGKGPFFAFNILSIGLDAFVTHMTNRMKGKMPGDSYKLWVDIAALFYDRIYRTGPMNVAFFGAEGVKIREFRETVLLMAMGVSGHRTYGAGKRILPDDRNVCLVRQMPLFRKLALKDMFTTGSHVDKEETVLFSAVRLEFAGEHPILAQMDGEAVLLEPGDFPAAIELTEARIPLLKKV